MQPTYEDLFEMADPLSRRPMRLGLEDPRFEAPTFHSWVIMLFRGETEATPPLRLVSRMGGAATDLIWSTYPPIMVVSQRVVDVLRAEYLTGWSTYAVEVLDRQGNVLEGFFGFAITGRAGDHDLERGEVIDKPPPVPAGKPYQVLKGLYLENDFWDGSDFCIVGRTAIIVVTRRVTEVFKRAKIGNVRFVPLPEMETNIGTLQIMGEWPPPGRRQT